MTKLIKMELYKLRTSKLFLVLLIVFGVINVSVVVGASALMNVIADQAEGVQRVALELSDAVSSPFAFALLMIFPFISLASFLYLDFADGYVKNIAGQLPNRGSIVFAKLVVAAVHNLIFFLTAALTNILGSAIAGMIMDTENLGDAIGTFCIKWLLSLGIGAIILFFAVGLRSKTFAVVLAVLLPSGALSLLYMGVDTIVANLLKTTDFSIKDYMPDSLIGSVNAAGGYLVANGVIVAVVCIAAFTALTYIMFQKKDIK